MNVPSASETDPLPTLEANPHQTEILLKIYHYLTGFLQISFQLSVKTTIYNGIQLLNRCQEQIILKTTTR